MYTTWTGFLTGWNCWCNEVNQKLWCQLIYVLVNPMSPNIIGNTYIKMTLELVIFISIYASIVAFRSVLLCSYIQVLGVYVPIIMMH